MPVEKCQEDGLQGWRWGDGGKCYTYPPGDEEASNEAKRLAYIQGAAITGESLKGLYLVSPQGRMIYDGLKTSIVKTRLDDALIGHWVIVSKESGTGLAFGEADITQPFQVSSTAFKDYFHVHQVTESDRLRWWQDANPLFLYPVTHFKAYETPLEIDVPPGVQMIMEDVKFKSFQPPKGVQDAAARGLRLREEFNRGGTEIGVARARDLSNGRNISMDTIRRMVSYFARHEVDKDAPGFDTLDDPSAGRIAWELWGGDPGRTWANRIWAQGDEKMEEMCVCEKCGATILHEKGVPCREIPCPECGDQMIRDGEKATFPLADRSRPWDADAAISRLRRWADAEDTPNAKYATAFMWVDKSKPENFTSYKFPFVDLISGEPHAIPHALSNILTRLDSSTIPEAAKDDIRAQVASYQADLKAITCPECGAELDDEATECTVCGVEIDRALVTQTATQVKEASLDDEVDLDEKVSDESKDLEGDPPLPVIDHPVDPEANLPTETKQGSAQDPSEGQYLLARRSWTTRHESALSNTLGSSTTKVAFDLFIKDPRHGGVRYSILSGAPPGPVSIQPAEMAQIITPDDKKYDPMVIPDQLDIKEGTLYNQNGPATMVVVERGGVTVITHTPMSRKYDFSGEKFNGTWTVTGADSGWMMEQDEGQKAGRRVQEAKLAVVTRAARRLKEILGLVQGEVVDPLEKFKKWALYEDETVEDAMSRAPRSILDLLTSRKDFSHGAAFAFKAADGSDWWMQWTTNAFIDREKEIFTTKSLEDYVARHDADDPKGEFWFWHIPGSKFATVKWQAVIGRFLVQAGPFDPTPVGQAFKEFFREHPDGHEAIAPQGWGTSHGYYYSERDREDGIYEALEIKESTVLPWHRAANQFSPAPRIIQEVKEMNDEQRKGLVTAIGPEMASGVEEEGLKLTKDLEEGGVDFKEVAETVEVEVTPETEVKEVTPEVEPKVEVIEPPAVEQPVEVKETSAEPEPTYLTQDALIEAVKMLTDAFRDELTEMSKSIDNRIESIQQSQAEESKQLQEQISETPAASLSDVLRSVIGRPEIRVEKKEAETLGSPSETAEAKDTGPFFSQWIPGG